MKNATVQEVIITGANGFIGSYLVDYFLEHDFHVTALVHNFPGQMIPSVRYQLFDLKNEINEEAFLTADYLVHCAYIEGDRNSDAVKKNFEGTKQLLSKCRKYNLAKVVFISSFSAHEEAVSAYGISKFETEKLFDISRDLILKPGLVVGRGGLYQRISSLIRKSKLIPLIDNGKQLIQTLAVDDLAKVIEKGIVKDISGIYPIAEIKPITIKEMYRQVCKKENKNPILIPVSFFIAHAGISFFNLLGLKTPISNENLLGLKFVKSYDVLGSVETFGMNFKTISETLKMI